MNLPPEEIRRLKTLLAYHREPPTWRRFAPRIVMSIGSWLVLLLFFAFLAANDLASPLAYYSLGVMSFVPIVWCAWMRKTIQRWPITEQIVDWQKVHALIRPEKRSPWQNEEDIVQADQ